jgi:chromosome segregation ATPase
LDKNIFLIFFKIGYLVINVLVSFEEIFFMKKIILLLLILCNGLFINVQAQKKIQPTTPKPATTAPAQPKGPIPYILKKDFEVIQTEMNAKIKSATEQANAAKQVINSKMSQVSELNNKMVQVEEILNSANFKISLQSDSLKSTRMLIEELKAEQKAHFEMLQAENASLKSKDTTLMVIIGVLGFAIIGLLFWQIGGLKKSVSSQIKSSNSRMEADLNKMDSENREAITNAISKMQGELNYLRGDINTSQTRNLAQIQATFTERANADKESTTSQLISLHDQIEQLKEQVNSIANKPIEPKS